MGCSTRQLGAAVPICGGLQGVEQPPTRQGIILFPDKASALAVSILRKKKTKLRGKN